MPLPEIRTPADASTFAKNLLADVTPPVLLSADFSQNLLAAVIMQIAEEGQGEGMGAVLYYLTDPLWGRFKTNVQLAPMHGAIPKRFRGHFGGSMGLAR